MASGDQTDVLRSLRRYVALTLGEPWKVRIGRTHVSDEQRPVAVVEASAPTTTPFARAGTLRQGDVQKARTFTVVAYPELGETGQDATVAADELAGLLEAGIERGLVTDDNPPVLIGAPFRIPIYDFAGVPVTGPNRAGASAPYHYANVTVSGFNVRPVQDPLDDLRYTVVATIPLTWWRGGRVGVDGPPVQRIPGSWGNGRPDGPPPPSRRGWFTRVGC